MRYIIITLSNGYCGWDEEHYLIFPKDTSDDEISEYAETLTDDYAASYEWLAEDSDEDMQLYYEECRFDWVEVFEGDEDFNYHIEEFSMA